MTETHIDDPAVEQIDAAANGDGGGTSTSLLDRLRAQREAQTTEKIFEVEVPGWRGLVGLHLKPVGAETLQKILDRVNASKSPERNFNANADTLISACKEVVGRPERDAPWEVLTDKDDQPVRLDERLAEMLKLDATRARDVVRQLFGGANSPEMAVGVAAGEYAQWCGEANADVDEDFLGES